MDKKIIQVSKLSNEEFINQYAAPGCVGLVGGAALIDRTIRKVQGKIFKKGENSLWSHAFLFSGKRIDGHQWLLESDIEIHRKQIKVGVQETRGAKYFDDQMYPNLAILDFGLTEEKIQLVLSEGLELLSGRTKYSLRELLGTLFTAKHSSLRSKENIFAQESSFYCSAMVQHCFSKTGIHFNTGVSTKNITPEDIANTTIPHIAYLLVR